MWSLWTNDHICDKLCQNYAKIKRLKTFVHKIYFQPVGVLNAPIKVNPDGSGYPHNFELDVSDHTRNAGNSNFFEHKSDIKMGRNLDIVKGDSDNKRSWQRDSDRQIIIIWILWVNLGNPQDLHWQTHKAQWDALSMHIIHNDWLISCNMCSIIPFYIQVSWWWFLLSSLLAYPRIGCYSWE